MAKQLPKWLSRRKDGVFEVDPDVIYPEFLKALGVDEIDQYWIEVVYQCTKLEVQRLVSGTELDPRSHPDEPRALQIRITADGGRKDRWALNNHPEGRGIKAATAGREARDHYVRLMGVMPQ